MAYRRRPSERARSPRKSFAVLGRWSTSDAGRRSALRSARLELTTRSGRSIPMTRGRQRSIHGETSPGRYNLTASDRWFRVTSRTGSNWGHERRPRTACDVASAGVADPASASRSAGDLAAKIRAWPDVAGAGDSASASAARAAQRSPAASSTSPWVQRSLASSSLWPSPRRASCRCLRFAGGVNLSLAGEKDAELAEDHAFKTTDALPTRDGYSGRPESAPALPPFDPASRWRASPTARKNWRGRVW